MCSRFLSVGGLLLAFVVTSPARVLRVCADPNNLPFSNQAQQGFENRIAEILAHDLGAKLEYFWWPERKVVRREYAQRNIAATLLIGVPSALDAVLTTAPYYRSTYVFVSRRDRQLAISSLDDPRLGTGASAFMSWAMTMRRLPLRSAAAVFLRTWPATACSAQRMKPNPPAKLISAVANGDVDVAIAWGPLAGYFASMLRIHSRSPLCRRQCS